MVSNKFLLLQKKDKKVAIAATAVTFLILLIILYVFKIEILDPPPRVIPVDAKIDLSEMIIDNFKIAEEGGGGGSGTPKEAPVVKKAQEQVEQVLSTKKNNTSKTVFTGKSTSTTGKNTQNTSTTTEKSHNPFGSGGSGGGNGGGRGTGFGNDDGPGEGPGNGPGKGGGEGGRIRLNNLNQDNIYSEESETVNLILYINAQGDVVDAQKGTQSTTVDATLINKVREEVKRQIKYNKKVGAGLERVFLTVNIRAK